VVLLLIAGAHRELLTVAVVRHGEVDDLGAFATDLEPVQRQIGAAGLHVVDQRQPIGGNRFAADAEVLAKPVHEFDLEADELTRIARIGHGERRAACRVDAPAQDALVLNAPQARTRRRACDDHFRRSNVAALRPRRSGVRRSVHDRDERERDGPDALRRAQGVSVRPEERALPSDRVSKASGLARVPTPSRRLLGSGLLGANGRRTLRGRFSHSAENVGDSSSGQTESQKQAPLLGNFTADELTRQTRHHRAATRWFRVSPRHRRARPRR
jgi:hypothetical protein